MCLDTEQIEPYVSPVSCIIYTSTNDAHYFQFVILVFIQREYNIEYVTSPTQKGSTWEIRQPLFGCIASVLQFH